MPEGDTLFNSREMTELQSTVVDVLRETALRGELIDIPYLQWALEFWAELDESDEVDEWVDRTVENQEGLLLFIDGMSATTVVGWDTPVQFVDPRWLGEYMDLDELEARISSIDTTKLSEDERDIVDRFKLGMKMLDHGKDPSSPESWIFG